MRILTALMLLVGAAASFAQNSPPLITEEMAETQASYTEGSGSDEIPDPEQEWFLDVNTSDVTEILSSPLITFVQAQALLKHRERFGRFVAVEELQVIDAFDPDQLRKLKPFLSCGRALIDERFQFRTLLATARHEVRLRIRRILQDREGYGDDGNYPFYKGDPNQINIRYRMQAGRYFSAGMVMEKDAGEPFFARKNGGRMDFFSWHVYLKPERWIETISIGDYQVQFGQGLVAWNGMSLGKSPEVQQFYRRGAGIRPYASSGEAGFNRGLAFTVALRRLKIDYWLSFLRQDASLFPVDTSFKIFLVSSILESGLHRSVSEMNDHAILGHFLTGTHLLWEGGRWRHELTLQYHHFEYSLWPGDDPYENFDPAGKQFLNAGWAWRYLMPNAILYSEIAVDAQKDPALITGLLFMPDRRWTISFHLRKYNRAYQCMGCDALREGSKTQNEQGFLSGVAWQVTQQLKWQAYSDYFRFPWLRYTSSAPSDGTEWQSQLTYTPARNTEVYLRYKEERKPVDVTSEMQEFPELSIKKNIRFNLSWMSGKDWEFQSRCEWTGLSHSGLRQQGFVFYQEARYKPMGKPYSFALRWSVFKTDSYDARIYTYEQDMAGAFSLPAYSGDGFRYYLMTRYRLLKGLDIWIRYSVTAFLGEEDPSSLSTGQNEIKMQIRWQF